MDEFEALYRQHASAVFRFAWGLCGDRNGAEDIVSDTFVRVLTRAPKIKTRTALAYLLAVARNTYLNSLRKRRREVELNEEIPAPERDPGRQIDDQARLEAVLRDAGDALASLYLLRGERHQAIATLEDLTLRTQDRNVVNWVNRRLKEIAGG